MICSTSRTNVNGARSKTTGICTSRIQICPLTARILRIRQKPSQGIFVIIAFVVYPLPLAFPRPFRPIAPPIHHSLHTKNLCLGQCRKNDFGRLLAFSRFPMFMPGSTTFPGLVSCTLPFQAKADFCTIGESCRNKFEYNM